METSRETRHGYWKAAVNIMCAVILELVKKESFYDSSEKMLLIWRVKSILWTLNFTIELIE